MTRRRFGLIPVRSPLLGESMFLSVPAGNEMFQFPAFPPAFAGSEIALGRFPDLGHPRIIACLAAPRGLSQPSHVLLRLWTPRHPPYTLCSLTTLFFLRGCHAANQFTLFSKNRGCPAGITLNGLPSTTRAGPARTLSGRPGWRRPDSNRRPPGCKPGALPAELRPRAPGSRSWRPRWWA